MPAVDPLTSARLPFSCRSIRQSDATGANRMRPTTRVLIDELHLILFNHRIGQHIARNLIDLGPGRRAIRPGRERDLEELALAHSGDGGMPQSRQCRPYSLPLRIE